MGEGGSGSTLGTKSGRTSNIEANEYLRSKKENRQEKKAEAENTEDSGPIDEPFNEEAPQTQSSYAPSGKPIYEWRDENGTLHISNDLGNVPPEYQDQLFEAQTEDSGE